MMSVLLLPRRKLRALLVLLLILTAVSLFLAPLSLLLYSHYYSAEQAHYQRLVHRGPGSSLHRFPQQTIPPAPYTRRRRLANIQCFPAFMNVCNSLKALGYEMTPRPEPDTDVLWTREQTIRTHGVKRTNHMGATKHLYHKPMLLYRRNNISVIAPAFYLPAEKKEFEDYANDHPDWLWIRKNPSHRGVRVDTPKAILHAKVNTIVQQFLSEPLLISNRKFDIGVFSLVTSVAPLRMYIYTGDFQVKFCPADYLPFDSRKLDKYVERSILVKVWEIPDLMKIYTEGKRDKDVLYTYLDSKGYSSQKLDDNMLAAATEVGCKLERNMATTFSENPVSRESFEFLRFDFSIDTNLKAWVIEINMTPDTKTKYKSKHKPLFTTMLGSTMVLAGLVNASWSADQEAEYTSLDTVTPRDIDVDTPECLKCDSPERCKVNWRCLACSACLKDDHIVQLKRAVLEQRRRGAWTRVVPPPFKSRKAAVKWDPRGDPFYPLMSESSQRMAVWYRAKCIQDIAWCS